MKPLSEFIGLPQTPEARDRRRKRIKKPLAVSALIAIGIHSAIAGINYVRESIEPRDIGCVPSIVLDDGRFALGAVQRGIDDLRSRNPNFKPAFDTETIQQAKNIGPVDYGGVIRVCGTEDGFPFGDSVTAAQVHEYTECNGWTEVKKTQQNTIMGLVEAHTITPRGDSLKQQKSLSDIAAAVQAANQYKEDSGPLIVLPNTKANEADDPIPTGTVRIPASCERVE